MEHSQKYIEHDGDAAASTGTKKTRGAKWQSCREIYILTALVLLILLLFFTGLGKVFNHAAFVSQLHKQPLPHWSMPLLSYLLPTLELGAVLLMCIPQVRIWGLGLALVLMTAYTIYAYLAYIEIYGYVPCACGKVFEKMSWKQHFLFNLAVTLFAAPAWLMEYKLKLMEYKLKKQK
ncbi:MAG: hypothetical protein LBV59_09855 [Sphingobacterium sp.]|jgi:hypothetical protein|uniref:MauE/DoxX family redox-associated membrane protein n=1 Tax=Sphingobacterium sp. TaxID=341027 RepID=UPI00283CD5AB|nr:MauE/DoxX family redox-associated membrane protein [Sphingobacterium sp.]MDR3008226.1 hypothetical protein [Sphingobacterium sp.]